MTLQSNKNHLFYIIQSICKCFQKDLLLVNFWWIILECLCNIEGTVPDTICDANDGDCTCKNELITGRQCNACVFGYSGFPNCEGAPFYFELKDLLWLSANSQ